MGDDQGSKVWGIAVYKDGKWQGYAKPNGYITRKKIHASLNTKEKAEAACVAVAADNPEYTFKALEVYKGR
jgi:hypothetical protein